ncbi:hypothetical protein MMC22_004295 [Lobaria immixta]|nr:hypothetical protein [Lobaria immixta]
MNGSSVPRHCAVVEAGMPSNDCPSSEWDFMQTWISLTDQSVPIGLKNQSGLLKGTIIPPSAIQLTGKTSIRQYKQVWSPVYVTLGTRNSSSNVLFESADSSTQQAVIADALTSISTIWDLAIGGAGIGSHHGASFHEDQKVVHTIANNYYQPYSSAFCVRDAIQGPNDQRIMIFPIVPESTWDARDTPYINASISGFPGVEAPIRRAQLLELPGVESDNRAKWIQLPQIPLTGVSVGLIVLLPQNPSDLSKQSNTTIQNNTDIVVCSIGAGWGLSSINMTSAQGTNSATSSLIKFDISTLNSTSDLFFDPFDLTDSSVLFAQPVFPSIPIETDVEWAEYLNPYVPSANTTVIDLLIKHWAGNGSKPASPEIAARDIITGLMTNGLARSGFTSELQGKMKLIKENQDISQAVRYVTYPPHEIPDGNLWLSGKSDLFTLDPEESKNWVKLKVDSTIQGYAYNIEGPAPKIAIAFLLTYCCFVLSHLVYSGISGISSSCWDSVSEVTALAINSPPTTILRNTCAGIAEIRIFRTPIRILTMRDQEGEGEHLELVFGEVDHEDSQKRAIKPNRKYGTMPAVKKDTEPARKRCRQRKGRHLRKKKTSQA